VLYEPHCWAQYPEELKERYLAYLYTDAADGTDGEMFVSEELCMEVLKDKTIFLSLANGLNDSFERARTQAITAYVGFIETEEDPQLEWPDFKSSNFDKTFRSPGDDKLRVIFDRCFDLIFPYLQRDQYSRTPGVAVKWDGTFDFMKKTMHDKNSEEENNVLAIVFGEYGHVMTWAFAESEGKIEVYQRLNYFLRKRCEMIGAEHAKAVQFAYTDTCCEGLTDPTMHWITDIWENCKRAPYKDLFHAQKKVMDATRGAKHDLHLPFCKALKKACMHFATELQNHVYKLFCRQSKLKYSREVGIEKMMEQRQLKKKVKNYLPSKTVMLNGIDEAFGKIVIEDQRLKNEAVLRGEGYRPYIMKPVTGVRRGTCAEVENMKRHIRQGCLLDHFNVHQMNVAIDPDDEYSDLLRLRSTSQGESFNKQAGRLTTDIGCQTAVRGHKRLWLRIVRFNMDKDKRLFKVLKIEKPRSVEWYIHEALLRRHQSLSLYQGIEFSPCLPDGYFEPNGNEYGRYNEWDKVQEKINQLHQQLHQQESASGTTATATATTTATVTGLAASSTIESGTTVIATTTPAASSNIVSNANMQDVLNATTVTTNAVHPSGGMPRGDNYCPQAVWNRQLGQLSPHVSFFNTYLTESKELSPFQLQCFWQFAEAAWRIFGGESVAMDSIADTVTRAWNSRHVHLQQTEYAGIGLGGLMRTGHAKALLRKAGYRIRAESMGLGNSFNPRQEPAPLPPSSTMKRLGKRDIDSLSYSTLATSRVQTLRLSVCRVKRFTMQTERMVIQGC
jgi:hypothetical protein